MWFRTLFDSLKPGRSRTPVHPARRGPPRRRRAACRLTVEALEDRSVPASLTVSDVTLLEGNAGTTNAVVTVSLSAPSTQTVTVNYRTADGTARAGSDYQAVSGKLTFAPGVTSKSILVPVIGDSVLEPNETFFVKLRDAEKATIADGQGIVTIVDDDPRPPTINIGDVSATEGNEGTTPMTFTVSVSAATTAQVTVTFATQDGSATAGSDYQATSGTLTFAPGETTKTITVLVNGDRLGEPDETFFVNLSNLNYGVIADGHGQGTIVDDEPRISIDDPVVAEGNEGTTLITFTVSLSAAYDEQVIVSFATADGTATTADNDYLAAFGTLTFAPGETTKTITVEVIGGATPEPEETFYVNLSGASTNAFIAESWGTGWILDDDGWIQQLEPCLSFDWDAYYNGTGGATADIQTCGSPP